VAGTFSGASHTVCNTAPFRLDLKLTVSVLQLFFGARKARPGDLGVAGRNTSPTSHIICHKEVSASVQGVFHY
jgi:hypothetical protein